VRVSVSEGISVAVTDGRGVRVGVNVRVGVGVLVGVSVGAEVGGMPVTVKRPDCFQSSPTNN
jgi:hypothetical protein